MDDPVNDGTDGDELATTSDDDDDIGMSVVVVGELVAAAALAGSVSVDIDWINGVEMDDNDD
jgi:hypothetical protein